MNILLHPVVVVFSLISLPLVVVCLDLVPVQFEKTPVLVASGRDAVFTVQTVSDVSLIRWSDSTATTLAMWANGSPVVMSVQQYQGRISVTATQLKITNSQIRDSGNYSVSVEPSSTTGLSVNTRTVPLKVFDAVNGVVLSLPSLPLEGGNVSLSCSWSAGSEVSVVWGKGGAALSSDSRITISAGSLLIKQARRDDAGEYTCTVSNAVSAQTAKTTLSVYYGPDAPQLTKTSSECVGGGDATVGQTVRLTCTSASLPPASFSWELNGQPVTTGQSGSGVLSLQIFSSNQSGRYICIARNDITGGTSKQQIDLAIVGTCLSGGAVAGIVVACVVALIIIIVVIILLLRQRNVDRRLRDTIGLQKTNQNEGTTIANRALVNENHHDPTLHNSLPQNFTAVPNNNNGNINTMSQIMPSNSNPLHHNGHLHTDAFQRNFSTVPDNGHQSNSYPNNDPQRSFPQPVQHNPNILIQTGSSQPGALAHTVHVNLNTLPRTDQFNNSQPQTVHVNLNTYPPEANQVVQQHADHGESALQSQHTNANHQNHSQTGLLNSDPLRLGNQTQTMLNNASSNGSRQPNSLIQTGYSHPTNQTNANRQTANSRSSAEERSRRSNPLQTNNQFNDSRAHLQQMPLDRLQGTPAYPNPEVYSSDSSGSSDWPQRDARRDRSGLRYRETEPLGRLTQAAPPQRRDLQRPIVLNNSQLDPNVQRQVVQQNLSTQPQVQSQIQTAIPQTQTSQGQTPIPIGLPRGTIIPETQTGTRPNQTVPQPSIPLTEAALRQHTAQTDNPFANWIQQSQAALQNPGPSQPIQQLNKVGQMPPTPPPVLRPDEFQKLPRERMQQPRTIQPVTVQRRHRSPNVHKQTRVLHTSPQRMPGVHPMHATMHGHPTHMRQVHRGRPRR
ncbi:GATA zinc finger domain-containing protein 14 [Sinocyclocheilus rhinocerous]|uniref:GATA zinc finger domain-containing protein 14 n=1 Tax=Sinocyclocheilus rhinocerous TaxID=307959 RepID=UPI0007B8E26C|nr:PREDICTED: GATA zinc finger domain-containing protein 14-like [Sinocyclocheilus rhinocerous]